MTSFSSTLALFFVLIVSSFTTDASFDAPLRYGKTRQYQSISTKAPASTKAPKNSTKAPSPSTIDKSTKAPTVKSTKAPTDKAPKETKAPATQQPDDESISTSSVIKSGSANMKLLTAVAGGMFVSYLWLV
jgi:outer membrane biosynthesis protein TonB